jgi:hypothetical protein
MAHVRQRSVLETSTTTGTGALTLAGTAVAGFRTFASVCSVNDTVRYRIWGVDANGNATGEWEDGFGTYSATNTLTRTTPLQGSSGALTAVTFSAGTKWVAITSFEYGTLSPAQITANQNDYAPTGAVDADIWRLTSDQARRITGIGGGYDGREIELHNVNTAEDGIIIVNHEGDTTSSAANRLAAQRDLVLFPNDIARLRYDGAATRWRVVSHSGERNSSLQPKYEAEFLGGATADTGESSYAIWDLAVISSGTQAKIASLANHLGILQISSSTTANSGAYIRTSVDAILLQGGEVSEHRFRAPAAFTNTTGRLGFIDTGTSTDCTDGAYFEFTGSGALVGKTSNNSTRTTSATIATMSASTWYRLRITVDRAAANVTFTVLDDGGNQLGTQTNSANIPTTAGRETGHGMILTNSGTTATALGQIDYMSLEWTKALI